MGYDVCFELSVFMNLCLGSNAPQNIFAFKNELVTPEWISVQGFVCFFQKKLVSVFMTLLTLDSRGFTVSLMLLVCFRVLL